VDEHGSPYEVAKEQKGHIPTSSNIAYGHVKVEVAKEKKGDISTSSNVAYGQMKKEEGVGDSEYEMCDMPYYAAMATQETTYEAIPT